MKDLYLSACFLLCTMVAFSQNKNNHWQLGPLDFNFSTNPNTISTIGGISNSSNYGYASISDDSGNLLFYTDGITVWNKNHQIMQNGANLGSYSESSQRVIIVPHPGNSSIYYIFKDESVLCLCNRLSSGYYIYSMVDFTSNSLGALVSINSSPDNSIGERNIYTKALRDIDNSLLAHAYTYSPLTFAKNARNDGYWVIVQDENRMLSYEVTATGLNTSPVISSFAERRIYNFGIYHPLNGSIQGIRRSMFRIASNTNTSKLYGLESSAPGSSDDPPRNTHQFYSLDFNSSTGQFANFQGIPLMHGGVAFNFELSPDLQKAYFVTYPVPRIGTTQDGQIFTIDLTNLASPFRLLYEFASPTTVASRFYSIQKDRHDNLLVSSYFNEADRNKYVHIINNPNSYADSKVKINHIFLNNKVITAFPQIIPNLEPNCIENIILNIPETVSNTYKVSNNIITNTNYIVNNGLTVILQAQNAIFLEPNTDIMPGSTFMAEIKNCTTSGRFGIKEYSYKELDENIKGNLTLYPNPADNFTTVALTEEVIKNIVITSIDGRVVFNKDVMQKSYELDVSSYLQGVYIVVVSKVNGEALTAKLVKK